MGTSKTTDYSAFSSDANTAMKEFRSKYGRAPTSDEIAGWRSAQSSDSGDEAQLPETATSNVMPGFGGKTQWDTIKQFALGPTNVATGGNQMTPFDQLDKPSDLVGDKLDSLSGSIDRLSKANASFLKGEIPDDMAASVRRAAAESSIAGGIFGSSSRALTARDLGMTSMQVRQQGIENETKLLESRSTLAAAHESIRQYNATRNATLAELSIKARDQNLSAIDVERQRISANIEANTSILQSIAQMVSSQQSIAATAAANKVDPTNIIASMDNWIKQFSGMLTQGQAKT